MPATRWHRRDPLRTRGPTAEDRRALGCTVAGIRRISRPGCSYRVKRPLRPYELTTMSEDALTVALAERVMGWRVAPGRFIKSGRSWIPHWRFSPLTRIT